MRQLALELQLADYARLDSFYGGPNAAVLEAVRHASRYAGQQVQWIWGVAGSGRSHLLQAAIAEAGAAGTACAWLPMASTELAPPMLEGMGRLELLCVDDVDQVAGDPAWESALFEVFEELRANAGRLLVSAAVPMSQAGFRLRDLASRLASGPTWRLQPLDDEQLLQALQLRANWRGLDLPTETGRFLLQRTERSNKALFALLDKLDKAALTAQRKLTIPFVRAWLEQESALLMTGKR
jgi:DnaA family protein